MSKTESKKWFSSSASKKQAALVVIAILILVVGIYVGVEFSGEIFGPPELPPIEHQTGYYQIQLYDPINDSYLSASNITRVNASNYVILNSVLTNDTSYYCDSASYLFVNLSAYYPIVVGLWASGSDDPSDFHINRINLQKKADPNDITFTLLRWYNETGNYWNYTNELPVEDGMVTLHCIIDINPPSRNSTFFGGQSWLPKTLLNPSTVAAQNNWTFITNWLGFECDEITDYQFSYPSSSATWPYQDIYKIPSTLNCSVIPTVWYSMEFYIKANFTNLQSVRLFDGVIDNYANFVGEIT